MNPAVILSLISELYAQVSALSQERDRLAAALGQRQAPPASDPEPDGPSPGG